MSCLHKAQYKYIFFALINYKRLNRLFCNYDQNVIFFPTITWPTSNFQDINPSHKIHKSVSKTRMKEETFYQISTQPDCCLHGRFELFKQRQTQPTFFFETFFTWVVSLMVGGVYSPSTQPSSSDVRETTQYQHWL